MTKILISALLIGPLGLIWFLHPDWRGRLAAVAFAHLVATILVLWLALNPKTEFLYPRGKIAKLGSPRTKAITRGILRSVTILFGLGLVLLTIPIVKDAFAVLVNKSASVTTTEGEVLGNSYPLGLYFIHQSPLVKKPGDAYGEIYSLFFNLTRLEPGSKYELVLAPQSRIVLDARQSQP